MTPKNQFHAAMMSQSKKKPKAAANTSNVIAPDASPLSVLVTSHHHLRYLVAVIL